MTVVCASESEIRLIRRRHFLLCSTGTNTGCDAALAGFFLKFHTGVHHSVAF